MSSSIAAIKKKYGYDDDGERSINWFSEVFNTDIVEWMKEKEIHSMRIPFPILMHILVHQWKEWIRTIKCKIVEKELSYFKFYYCISLILKQLCIWSSPNVIIVMYAVPQWEWLRNILLLLLLPTSLLPLPPEISLRDISWDYSSILRLTNKIQKWNGFGTIRVLESEDGESSLEVSTSFHL